MKNTIKNQIENIKARIFTIDIEYDFLPYEKWCEKQNLLNEMERLYKKLYEEFPEEKPKPVIKKTAKSDDDWFPDGWI